MNEKLYEEQLFHDRFNRFKRFDNLPPEERRKKWGNDYWDVEKKKNARRKERLALHKI